MTSNSEVKIVELSNGVFARLHNNLTNAGIIVGDDSVIVIDSLRVPSFARDLIKDVKHITNKPISHVIDTHSHWDHSWGNQEFPSAAIIGHDNCLKEMIDPKWNEQWRSKVVSSNESWSEEAKTVTITPPNITFSNSMYMEFGLHKIRIKFLGKAHTSGDIFIYLPDAKVLFTGDVAQNQGIPFFGDSYQNEWIQTSESMADISINAFMSGHGPIGAQKDLSDAKDFIQALIKNIMNSKSNGLGKDQTASIATNELKPRFGHWRKFEILSDGISDIYDRLID